MFSTLPDLIPRDSHSLWYTSSRSPSLPHHLHDNSLNTLDNHAAVATRPPATTAANPTQNTPAPNPTTTNPRQGGGGNAHHQSANLTAQIIDRSLLGRLQAEEQLFERRRAAVTNLGSGWLKPPGVTKTLFQMREERREAEEHAEAMRREMLAQELAEAAEAEAEAAAAAAAAAAGGEQDMGGMEGEEEEGVDLDADIPDGDAGSGLGFGSDGSGSDEDEEEEDEEDEEEEDDDDDDEEEEAERRRMREEEGLSEEERQYRREMREELEREQALEARRREVLRRNDEQIRRLERQNNVLRFDDGLSDLSEEERSQMLNEEDLVRVQPTPLEAHTQVPAGPDMNMDADLDDDIPEAESGGYEHTDSGASLDSDEDTRDLSYARSSRVLHHRSSLRRSEGPRSSLDISGLLSRDGSSIMGTSPHVRRGMY